MFLAILCGALIGAERTMSGAAAGIRTYAMVCLSTAVVMAVFNYPTLWAHNSGFRGVDPTRVVQGILAGIGFLGAGVIVRDGFTIRGLTSASAIWTTSVVGVLLGSGFYVAGILTTLFTTVLLSASPRLEKLVPKSRYLKVTILVDSDLVTEKQLNSLISESKSHVIEVSYQKAKGQAGFGYTFVLRSNLEDAERKLVKALSSCEGVAHFSLGSTSTK
ncbi:MgtC/SapB family protein [Nostoc sp. CHAB 5834]|nr:MgtC/SapB family protein [Nostoc sp. CHAB 5834]